MANTLDPSLLEEITDKKRPLESENTTPVTKKKTKKMTE